MQRTLIRLYEQYCPNMLRNAMPAALKAGVTGTLYRATHHPDLGFRHVRQLVQMGQGARAAALYAGEGADVNSVADPLFLTSITPRGGTLFHGELGYRGLWIGGSVPASKWVDIRLDGVVLRREKLRGKAALRYIIGRDALDLFPPMGRLDVVNDAGRVLAEWDVCVPHGQGGLAKAIKRKGFLEKKGGLRPDADELAARHTDYLALYSRVRAAFEAEFGKPVFILYGTLLGQHRSGEFIPGDDDFDVGYVSGQTSFSAVRDEAARMIERLVARGFVISLNAEGKPFRIRDDLAGPDIWLDNRPVFCPDDDHVWLHKQARLPLPLDDFCSLEQGTLSGHDILKPRNSEAFLAAYYGTDWRVPDPAFSNASKGIDPEVVKGLAQVNVPLTQQKKLAQEIAGQKLSGRFEPLALQPLYPLEHR